MSHPSLQPRPARGRRRPRARRAVALAASLALAGLALSSAATASAAALPATSVAAAAPAPTPTPTSQTTDGVTTPAAPTAEPVCGAAEPGHMTCFSERRTDSHVAHRKGVQRRANGDLNATAVDGFGPADLLSAYNLPGDGGAGTTIAIVDAYDNPKAEADLAVYRQQFGLPACTTDNGCFRKVDQRGGTVYPVYDANWAGEISLDVDMVSAIAPRATILLVEADSNSDADLGAAVNMAVTLGAGYVSNSWGGYSDSDANLADDAAYYDHPGTAIVFSSGDDGYGVSYPAASPYVTAVGGTSLVKDSSARGWSESVWSSGTATRWGAPGSGCSQVEPKPAYQHDDGCDGRSVADVSAVADPVTGVAVYDSNSQTGGWNVFGGTSASAPIIASTYALAGPVTSGTYPASYPYETPSALHDVTTGDNASCAFGVPCGFPIAPDCSPSYECQASAGYDGPTGLGTPDGLLAFKPGPHGTVTGTVTDATTGAAVAGASVALGAFATSSRADGAFVLDVPPGDYTLKVSAFGYATADLGTLHVADGDALTPKVTLTPVPSQTVSGTVTDGGDHGWGLYARISVDGVPGTAFTDPATGAFSLRLPAGATYTIRATALYAGYQAGSADVATSGDGQRAGAAPVTIALPLDTTGTMAPGYHIGYGPGGGAQTFDAAATPADWSVVTATGAAGWNFTDTLNRGNQTGGTGHFAQVDDYALGWGSVDTSLVSPVYDLSAQTAPLLTFDSAIAVGLSDQTEDVDVTTDGGATWSNLWHKGYEPGGHDHEELSLAGYAGQASVQLRFHFIGSLAGYWEVDDVTVGARTLVTDAGGLLVGSVTDANTRTGVLGAVVSTTGAAPVAAQTVATPSDPARAGGMYSLFVPGAGHQRLTAGLPAFGYPTSTGSASLKADHVTSADLTVSPARLELKTAAVAKQVPWGASATVDVTVRNKGATPARISLGEQASEATGTPDGAAWRQLADAPAGSEGGVAGTLDGVLYAGLGEAPGGQWSTAFSKYDPATAAWTPLAKPVTPRLFPAYGFVRGKLYVAGGRDTAGAPIAGGEVYDPKSDAWSAIAPMPHPYLAAGSAVVGDKLYVIGGCEAQSCGTTEVQVYDPATNTWSAGPSYLEPISYPVCGTIDAKVYCSGGAYEPGEGSTTDSKDTFVLDPTAKEWTQLASAPLDLWTAAGTTADGKLLVAGGRTASTNITSDKAWAYDPATDAWSALPDLPGPVESAASAPGWFVVGGVNRYNVPQQTVLELAGYDGAHADVAWLGEQADTLTIPAHQAVTVTLTLDASGMGPADAGAHHAALVVDADTPYGSLTLPVEMDVVAPH
ncbi:Kelch repeat-containing protein [Xylanimonas sp. McL0601]|uniref:Kelch repeat-containing protein n=1 Tax=Xylanimonas sp. McL0601 TaxID=3414739 RepID=UPI003CF60C5F